MTLAFDIGFEQVPRSESDDETLVLDLDGFEGPLDVLLTLARSQKVDLARLSVTRLADQYLAFLRAARARRFVVAADYLVMAAWLTYLKSRLLLPRPAREGAEEAPAEEVARRLAFRLAKLDAMRHAAEALEGGPILGRDVFARGDPQAVTIVSHSRFEGDLYDLVAAYVGQRRRASDARYSPPVTPALRLDEARERLRELLPVLTRWTSLSRVAPAAEALGPARASCVASTLSAGLELVKEGVLDARQLIAFDEVWLRARRAAA
jgi:segregation and condensation protein A